MAVTVRRAAAQRRRDRQACVREKSSTRSRRSILWAMASSIIVMLVAFIVYMVVSRLERPLALVHLRRPERDDGRRRHRAGDLQLVLHLVLTLIFTMPIAIAAGVYLQEYAQAGAVPERRAVQRGVARDRAVGRDGALRLAGLRLTFHWSYTALGGALTLTLLNLPALMRVTQEALASVPDTLREASMGLGGTKWQTITRVVLPSAIGRLTTGVVLIAGRIFGETAALIFTAGLSVPFNHPYDLNPFRPAETLAVHSGTRTPSRSCPTWTAIGNGSALVLLIMVLVFNVAARVLGRRADQTFHRENLVIDTSQRHAAAAAADKIVANDVNVFYGSFQAIKNASLSMKAEHVTALIGPSGCGKSTFLRALNRMHDLTPGARVEGAILLDGEDIYAPDADPVVDPSPHRDGVPAPEPVPQDDLRERRLRAAHPRRAQQARARRDRRARAASSGALGRGEGPAATVRRSISRAASSSACASRAPWRSIPK